MEAILAIGVVGSVASVISLLLAAPNIKSRLLHVSYAAFITVLATVMFHLSQRLQDYRRTERQAAAIVETADLSTTGSMAGFMLASLSVLEKNKILLPDTYACAMRLCDSAGCTEYVGESSTGDYQHFLRMQEASSAMMALMRGVAAAGAGK
jgi:hypothetical protein